MRQFARKLGGGPVLLLAGGIAVIDTVAAIIHFVHMETGLDLALAD
jgi:hypothetical protein